MLQVFIFSIIALSSSYACDINIKFKQLHGVQLTKQILLETAIPALADKGYTFTQGQSDLMTKFVISKGRDIQVFDKFFAKASVSLYKNGHMQNYTHGQGNSFDTVSPAYTTEMFKIAIETAVSHLPVCIKSN